MDISNKVVINAVLNYFNLSDYIHFAGSFSLLLEIILGSISDILFPQKKTVHLPASVIPFSPVVHTDGDVHIK